MNFSTLCYLLLSIVGQPVCPGPGEAIPHEILPVILHVAGWDDAYIPAGVQTAACESAWVAGHFNPYQTGDGGRAHGLFQIYQLWVDYFSDVWAGDLYDPLDNARLAWLIVRYDISRNQTGRNFSCWPAWGNQ